MPVLAAAATSGSVIPDATFACPAPPGQRATKTVHQLSKVVYQTLSGRQARVCGSNTTFPGKAWERVFIRATDSTCDGLGRIAFCQSSWGDRREPHNTRHCFGAHFAAPAANAADMALKAAPRRSTVFSWTGFYIGADVGGIGDHQNVDTFIHR